MRTVRTDIECCYKWTNYCFLSNLLEQLKVRLLFRLVQSWVTHETTRFTGAPGKRQTGGTKPLCHSQFRPDEVVRNT